MMAFPRKIAAAFCRPGLRQQLVAPSSTDLRFEVLSRSSLFDTSLTSSTVATFANNATTSSAFGLSPFRPWAELFRGTTACGGGGSSSPLQRRCFVAASPKAATKSSSSTEGGAGGGDIPGFDKSEAAAPASVPLQQQQRKAALESTTSAVEEELEEVDDGGRRTTVEEMPHQSSLLTPPSVFGIRRAPRVHPEAPVAGVEGRMRVALPPSGHPFRPLVDPRLDWTASITSYVIMASPFFIAPLFLL